MYWRVNYIIDPSIDGTIAKIESVLGKDYTIESNDWIMYNYFVDDEMEKELYDGFARMMTDQEMETFARGYIHAEDYENLTPLMRRGL